MDSVFGVEHGHKFSSLFSPKETMLPLRRPLAAESGWTGDIEDNVVPASAVSASAVDQVPNTDEFNQQLRKFGADKLFTSPVIDTCASFESMSDDDTRQTEPGHLDDRVPSDSDNENCVQKSITTSITTNNNFDTLLQNEQRRRQRRRNRHHVRRQLHAVRNRRHSLATEFIASRNLSHSNSSSRALLLSQSTAVRDRNTRLTRAQQSIRMHNRYRLRQLRATIFTRNRRELCENFNNFLSLDS